MYKILKNEITNVVIRENSDATVTYIPLSEANTDYQRYLAWVAEGNTPEVIEP